MSDPGFFNFATQNAINFGYYGGSSQLKIFFGDGSSEKRQLNGSDFFDHTYATGGEYDIIVKGSGRGVEPFHLHVYLFDQATTDLVVNGSGEIEYLVSGEGDDVINLQGGNDTVSGGGGDDSLAGGSGNDRLDGMQGNDTLRGASGDDILINSYGKSSERNQLSGGDGDDLIYNSIGKDIIEGGQGTDHFRLAVGHNFIGINQDEILDFSGYTGQGDKIIVPLNGTFIGDRQFDGQSRELRVISTDDSSGYIVQIDSNRDGKTDASFTVIGDRPTGVDFIGVKEEQHSAASNSHDSYQIHGLAIDHHSLAHFAIV